MQEQLSEILRRLEALEQRIEALEHREGHDCGFLAEEKRIVDLIVRLTAERIGEQRREDRDPPPPPPGGWGPPREHGHGPPRHRR